MAKHNDAQKPMGKLAMAMTWQERVRHPGFENGWCFSAHLASRSERGLVYRQFALRCRTASAEAHSCILVVEPESVWLSLRARSVGLERHLRSSLVLGRIRGV